MYYPTGCESLEDYQDRTALYERYERRRELEARFVECRPEQDKTAGGGHPSF